MKIVSLLIVLGGLILAFLRWKQLRKPQKRRDEINEAVTKHDNTKVNELLQDGLHRDPSRPSGE